MKSLFEVTSLNGVQLKNRVIRGATYEARADETGGVTSALLDFYANLVVGQIGMIITGGATVLPEGKGMPGMLGIHDDSLVDGYKQLTNLAHRNDSKIIMQLIFCGTQGPIEVPDVYSPSGIPEKMTGRTGQAMSLQDINRLKSGFVSAALRAKAAGFDGVQIHASAGFLLSQFLCPYYNRRTDQYGGPLANRMRLLCEIYQEIRDTVGKNFMILTKLNCADFIEDGLTFEDSLLVCKKLASLGIDAIEITGGMAVVREKTMARPNILSPEQEAYFSEYAAKIAESVAVPVILAGGLRSPGVLERLLIETKISYFSLCRPFIAEPGLVKRWQAGSQEKVKCLSCNKCLAPGGISCKVYN
jgi:2,4-dienoyl-CoA reductase-like NADH-dependent reductase (Old Yellow Enzyme family)